MPRRARNNILRVAIRAVVRPAVKRFRRHTCSAIERLLLRLGIQPPGANGGRYAGLPTDEEMPGPAPRVLGAAADHGMQAADVAVEEVKQKVSKHAPRGDDDEMQEQQKRWVSEWASKKVSKEYNVQKYSPEWADKIIEFKENVEKEARRGIRHYGVFAGEDSWEMVSKIYVKEVILHADSSYDLLEKCELLIDEDWLSTIDALPGNIYRMSAFNEFAPADVSQSWGEILSAKSRILGFVMILLIQLLGPPLVFFGTFGLGVSEDDTYDYAALFDPDTSYFYDWGKISTTKALGLAFMFAFVLNACYVAMDERDTFMKIYSTFTYLKKSTPNFEVAGHVQLLFGAFMDCWVVLWCSLDAFLIIGASQTPIDLLLDSTALIFLYNLDDIGGDFGFVDEDDWAGDRLGWVYDEMVLDGDDGYQLKKEEDKVDAEGASKALDIKWGIWLYTITAGICGVLSIVEPIIAIFVPFLQIA